MKRFELDVPLAPGDRPTFYQGGAKGYIDYPAAQPDAPPAPKGYWIVQATIHDPAQFGKYTAVAGPVIASYGGTVLARGVVADVVEGHVPRRPYLVAFPSYAAARACYHSPGYQAAVGLRSGVADFDIVVVEGI